MKYTKYVYKSCLIIQSIKKKLIVFAKKRGMSRFLQKQSLTLIDFELG